VPPSTPEVLCRGTSPPLFYTIFTRRWIARLSAGGTPILILPHKPLKSVDHSGGRLGGYGGVEGTGYR